MRRLLLACALLACLATAQKRTITHEDVWLFKRLGTPVLSPDGKLAVFSLTEPAYDSAQQTSDLWAVPTDKSAPPRRLTATKAAESSPEFSPDGKRLAFSARRDGDEVSQIYILPMDGGEAIRITNLSTGAADPHWSPDGKRILFQSEVYRGCTDDDCNKKEAARRKAVKDTARAHDTFPIRFWNFWLDGRVPHLFVQSAEPGAAPVNVIGASKLAAKPGFAGRFNPTGAGQSIEAAWTPDGAAVVFTAVENLNESMYAPVEGHLYFVAAAGGEPRRLTPPGSSWSSPEFSPDGKFLYTTTEKNETAEQPYHLTRLARAAAPAFSDFKTLTDAWDRSVGSFTFAPDSASLFIEAEDDGYDRIFRLPAAGGAPELLFSPTIGALAGLKSEAGILAGRFSSSTNPGQIATLDPKTRQMVLLTDFDAERRAALHLPPPEHFWFTSKAGRRIHSVIVPPPVVEPGKKYPLVVFPHGGPNSMSKDGFSTRWNYHLLTAPGYYLLMTNYKGSTGFGEKFADDIERDVLRGPAEEILEAADEAIKRYPAIDASRQASIGASYGGYLMNWFNGHTTRFRCLVNHAGAVNNESQYGVNDGGLGRELRMGSPVWEAKAQWRDQSPFLYAAKWKTPTLVTQGELDFRVPLSESITTYKLLQRLKIPSRILLFPDEGHWILKGHNSKRHTDEILGWLDKYLKP